MGIFDSLQLKKRLESAAGDVGKSIISTLTPKSPVPLSMAGLEKAATDKAKKTVSDGEVKAKGKVKDLEKATVGKVGSAVQGKIDNTAARVEAKFDGTLAKAEGKVDAGIAKVGSTVDKGIAGVDAKLDAAEKKATAFVSGKPTKAPAPAAAAAAPVADSAADTVEEKAADDTGAAPVVTGRKRANAVTAKPADAGNATEQKDADPVVVAAEAEITAEATVAEPATPDGRAEEPVAAAQVEEKAQDKTSDEDDDDIIPSWLFDDDSEEKFAAMETAEPDEDVGTDLEGAAAAAAAKRAKKAGGTNEVEITEEDASEFQQEDDFSDPDVTAEEKKGADEESGEELTDGEIEKAVADAEVDKKDQQTAVRSYKKKVREINGQLASTLGGGLATAKVVDKDNAGASKDPWVAYFVASAKFRKKLAARDFKEELAGGAKDEDKDGLDGTTNDAEGSEDKDETEAPDTAELPREQTEIVINAGELRHSDDSPDSEGKAVDTTSKETGSAEQKQVFAVDKTHKLYIAHKVMEPGSQSRLLDANDLLLAGEIKVKNGVIQWLSNNVSGQKESRADLVEFLRALREQGVKNDFDVEEASKNDETTVDELLAEAKEAEPEPEEADLVAEMAKNDKWKLVAKDFPQEAILAVAKEQGWELVSGDIVDGTGEAVDPTAARELLQKHLSKANAAGAAALVAEKLKAKAGAAVGG